MKKKTESNRFEAIIQDYSTAKYATKDVRGKRFGVVYTRVSSQEQAENNSSLETQTKLCMEYASRNTITIKQIFGGTYESAKSDGRKEFQHMLEYVDKDKEISFIIVYNFDRFSRTGTAAGQLSEQLRQKGIFLKSITQEIDSSTPSGSLQENFFHLFNNYDNQQRATRTKTNTREILLIRILALPYTPRL